MADVKYVVTVDSTGAQKSIETLDQAFGKLKNETKSLGTATGQASSSFSGMWKQFTIGQLVISGLHKAWRLFKDQVGDSVKAALEAEKVNSALEATLLITGREAAQLGEHFKNYASELQKVTIYDDEEIKSAQTLMLTLARLDKEGMDKATRGAIGLASALHMDLESAASLVAKAMAGNVGVLSRYGIKVSETLPLEQKRVELLKKLEVMFGRATAETSTFSGRLAVLKNRWGEVQEAAGAFISRQQGVINILDKASQAILDYLTMGAMLENATKSAQEQENKHSEWLGKAAVAAGWKYREMAKLIESYGGVTPALLMAINKEKYGIEIKREYQRVIREEREAWIALEAARKKAESGTGGDDGAVVKFKALATALDSINWGKHLPILAAVEEWLYTTTRLIDNQVPSLDGYSVAVDKAASHLEILKNAMEGMNATQLTGLEKWRAALEKISVIENTIVSQAGVIFQQVQRNKEIAIENEYKKRLANINKNIKDETARQKAVIALDSEFQIKRTSAAAAGAKQAKAIALAEAIWNTARAVTEALPNLVLAAVAAAMGAIQIGIIAKQPIPLAKGAYFNKPTLLGRGAYEVAEAHEPEFVLPESKLRAVFADVAQRMFPAQTPAYAMAGAGGVTVNINSPLVHTIGLSQSDLERAGDKMFQVIERQLRLRGRR